MQRLLTRQLATDDRTGKPLASIRPKLFHEEFPIHLNTSIGNQYQDQTIHNYLNKRSHVRKMCVHGSPIRKIAFHPFHELREAAKHFAFIIQYKQ